MLDMPFSDECFDMVIEKGTMVTTQLVVLSFNVQISEFTYVVLTVNFHVLFCL